MGTGTEWGWGRGVRQGGARLVPEKNLCATKTGEKQTSSRALRSE